MKVLSKAPVPMEDRQRHGLEYYTARISVPELWLRWFWAGFFFDDTMSWKDMKQAAKDGTLTLTKYFLVYPLWTHIVILNSEYKKIKDGKE
jgi:hypothetical protein